jgi:small subunit ribosomal protein S4
MRRIRKKFKRPKTAWSLVNIKEDRDLIREYGLRRKHELLVAREILRGFRQRARNLIGTKNPEEEQKLLDKLEKLGLLREDKELDDVLALNVNKILDRRLQTIVFKKGMAASMKQARQLITHGHITINGRRMTFPSCLVPVEKEGKISWHASSKVRGGVKKPPTIKPKPYAKPAREEGENAGE